MPGPASSPANQVTLGVIGHVDHGKTALVRALTGIETDRLREEQERGLSIVLGFSYLESSRGMIDLIDVPGHEDFVRTMISGATGIDGVVLIVAANEGVMPQTREHFDIAELLGVERGIIVLTKTDLVSGDELELAEEDVRDYLTGSFLENAPLVCTSAVRGEGMEALREALADIPVRVKSVAEGGLLPAGGSRIRNAGVRSGGDRYASRRRAPFRPGCRNSSGWRIGHHSGLAGSQPAGGGGLSRAAGGSESQASQTSWIESRRRARHAGLPATGPSHRR